PLAASIDNPGGNPEATNVTASPSGSKAVAFNNTLAYCPLTWLGIPVRTGGRSTFVMTHVNVRLPSCPAAVAMTVTGYVPALVYVGVPLMAPVAASMERPGGNPTALQATTSPSGSTADMLSETASFSAVV